MEAHISVQNVYIQIKWILKQKHSAVKLVESVMHQQNKPVLISLHISQVSPLQMSDKSCLPSCLLLRHLGIEVSVEKRPDVSVCCKVSLSQLHDPIKIPLDFKRVKIKVL